MIDGLKEIFTEFTQQKILVIGDVMLDDYLEGVVNRISPEAPVPVVDIIKRYDRLGGAANVALNLKHLGATPILCSVVGVCKKSDTFIELIQQECLSIEGIVRSETRKMTVKYRVLGNNVQLLRMDDEDKHQLSENEYTELIQRISTLLSEQKIAAIVFEDYDKGVISSNLIDEVVQIAEQYNIPITVDPKKRNFWDYHHISIFKPNLKELQESLLLDSVEVDDNTFETIANFMREKHHKNILLTLSEKGVIMLSMSNNELSVYKIPAHVRNVSDVSGAGDTVIATATLCLTTSMNVKHIAELANLAGGIVCEQVGVVAIEATKLYQEALKIL